MELGRRRFLAGASLALLAAAVDACTKDGGHAGGPTTTTQPTTTTLGPSPTDVLMLRTAASVEALAVSVYQRAARSGLVIDPVLTSAMTSFQSHHTVQQQTFNSLLDVDDIAPVTAANDALDREVFQPAFGAAATQADVVRALYTLEDLATQMCTYFTAVAVKVDHRVAFLTTGGAHARHRAVIGTLFGTLTLDDVFPSALAADSNPLPPDALLTS